MKLPHHLCLIGSTFYFRLKTPHDLVPVFGKRYLKHSLKTSDIAQAKRFAYTLTSAYLDQFSRLRAATMPTKAKDDEAERLKTAASFLDGVFNKPTTEGPGAEKLPMGIDPDAIKKWHVAPTVLPDGTIQWAVDDSEGAEDLAAGQAEADRRNKLGVKPYVQPVAAFAPVINKPSKLLSASFPWFFGRVAIDEANSLDTIAEKIIVKDEKTIPGDEEAELGTWPSVRRL